MALVTVPDYQNAANELLWYIDQAFGQIDRNGMWVMMQMLPEDFQTLLTNYNTYKQNRLARPTSSQLPGTVGTNKTTFETGGRELHS